MNTKGLELQATLNVSAVEVELAALALWSKGRQIPTDKGIFTSFSEL